jgi:hypothetical protein
MPGIPKSYLFALSSCYWLYMLKKFQYWDWRLDFLMPPDQPNFACSFFYFLIWMTGMAQWQLNILISLNRFISLMFPELYKKVSAHVHEARNMAMRSKDRSVRN